MKRLRGEVRVDPGSVRVDTRAGHVVACGDSRDLEFLRRLIDATGGAAPDLLLTDPPYAVSSDVRIGIKGRKDIFLNEGYDRLSKAQLARLLKVTVENARELGVGNQWIWTSDAWISYLKRWMEEAGYTSRPTFVWAKPNPPCSFRKSCMSSACEFLTMSQSKGSYFDLDAMPRQRNYWVMGDSGLEPARCDCWVERPTTSQKERLRRPDGEYLNRAQKPLDLLEPLVRTGCPEGGVVLDCFGGTGTTLIAADRTGRRCVYVERDPVQVKAALDWLRRDRGERARKTS